MTPHAAIPKVTWPDPFLLTGVPRVEASISPPTATPVGPDRRTGLVSVVLPALNEAETLPELTAAIFKALESRPRVEIIVVDDGSRDPTLDVLRELHTCEARLGYVSFSRNFGHQAALTAGYDVAEGEAVITMDSDFQHPPEEIPRMLEEWVNGADVVQMVRRGEQHRTLSKVVLARLFHWFFDSLTTEVNLPHGSGDFRLVDRRVVLKLRILPEKRRFLRGLIPWLGFRQVALGYQVAARRRGTAKYTFWRSLHLAADGLFSFSSLPLRLVTLLGLLLFLLGGVGGVAGAMAFALSATPPSGWVILVPTLGILSGIQLLALGVVGEYVGRIYDEAKERPTYVLKEVCGARERPPESPSAPASAPGHSR